MAGANDRLADLQVQHALHLLAHGNAVNRDIQKLLSGLEKEVIEKLASRLASIEARGFDLGPSVTKRLEQTVEEIRALNGKVYGKTEDQLNQHLIDLAKEEVTYGAKAIEKATGIKTKVAVASPERLRSIVTERPMQGKMLASWFKGAEAASADRLEAIVRNGMASGQTIDQMVREVRGANGMAKSKAWAESLVRTSVTHVSNHAQMESFKRNSNIIKGWQFMATLDSRTTIICASHDAEVYPLGEGPMPPLHPNCRSTITAVTKSFKDMGFAKDDYTADQRASMDGSIANPGNFEKWLKNQSEDRQNEVLGKARADLWRSGKYALSDFVRDRNTVISLQELRGKNAKLTATEPAKVIPSAPAAPAEPKAFSPVNAAVTDETLRVEPRLALQKAMTAKLKNSAADPRHWATPEYRGSKVTNFGKAQFPTDFDDRAVSAINAVLPECDAICDAFGVPRIRGLKPIKSAAANMGDAVMGLDAQTFNRYALRVGGAGDIEGSLVKAKAAQEELTTKMGALRKRVEELDEKRRAAIQAKDWDTFEAIGREREPLAKEWEKLRKTLMASVNKVHQLENAKKDAVASQWMSIGVQTGPPIGAQKGPPFTMAQG